MSNSLDPDHFVGSDLGPNCLQSLSGDKKKSLLARKGFKLIPIEDLSSFNRAFIFLFDLILYVPVNNFSVMSGCVFLR